MTDTTPPSPEPEEQDEYRLFDDYADWTFDPERGVES